VLRGNIFHYTVLRVLSLLYFQQSLCVVSNNLQFRLASNVHGYIDLSLCTVKRRFLVIGFSGSGNKRHNMTKIDGYKYFRKQQGCKFVVSFHVLIHMLLKKYTLRSVHLVSFNFICQNRKDGRNCKLITAERVSDVLICTMSAGIQIMNLWAMKSCGLVGG
jgi:hypothetical protein